MPPSPPDESSGFDELLYVEGCEELLDLLTTVLSGWDMAAKRVEALRPRESMHLAQDEHRFLMRGTEMAELVPKVYII